MEPQRRSGSIPLPPQIPSQISSQHRYSYQEVLMHSGYSLLELILVCGLVGTVSSVGVSYLGQVTAHYKLQLAGESFSAALSAARFQAVAKNLDAQILVHPDRRQFAVAVQNQAALFWQELPEGVFFSTLPARPPVFHSRGFASPAGSFALANKSGEIQVVVSLGGRIRWERVH